MSDQAAPTTTSVNRPKNVQRSITSLVLLAVSVALAQPARADLADQRTIDGTNNNLAHPAWGSAGSQLIRFGYNAFYPGDGSGSTLIQPPARPNPRDISNAIFDQPDPIRLPNDRGLSDYIWQWGQFVTHDMDLTGTDSVNGTAPIAVDPLDPIGPDPIPFNRSNFDPATGTSAANPRQQINQVTSYIDASMIYGSDAARANALRTFNDGKLFLDANGLLQHNDGPMPFPNDDSLGKGPDLFLSGDVRANVQVGLTAMHTIFTREHNRLADAIAASPMFTLPTDPGDRDEAIYQIARKIVGAEIESITYNEYLPALMGDKAPPLDVIKSVGYLPSEQPDVTQTFAHALFRFGHLQQSPTVQLRDPTTGDLQDELSFKHAFFNPEFIEDDPGQTDGIDHDPSNIDRLLLGLSKQLAEGNNGKAVDAMRNFLFGPPGAGGLDLISLDIQRGRDHGLPDYNQTRNAYGLPPITSVTQITSDPDVQAALTDLYGLAGHPDDEPLQNIDLFVAAMLEDHEPGSSLGETARTVIFNQFVRLALHDRFFYLFDEDLFDQSTGLLQPDVADVIDLNNFTLRDVILANTTISPSLLQPNVFVVPEPTSALLLAMVGWALLLTRGTRPTTAPVSRSPDPSSPPG